MASFSSQEPAVWEHAWCFLRGGLQTLGSGVGQWMAGDGGGCGEPGLAKALLVLLQIRKEGLKSKV